ncbi:unnamed protein product [Effrenium voratum]|nr:unnamed protein product [Effrenium voratum]
MACVRLSSGREVMTEQEFATWFEATLELRQRNLCFFDVLRQEIARRMQLGNFRRLRLVCDHALGPHSPWTSDAAFLAVVRPYVQKDAEAGNQLFEAALEGDSASLVRLLEEPHDPNAYMWRTFDTLLHVAAANGEVEVARCLLEAGASKEAGDINTETPLHHGAVDGHVEVVRCLLEAGADKDAQCIAGQTPLHAAAMYGYVEVARCLLDAGADTAKLSFFQRLTPLHVAAQEGHAEVARCLLEAGADKDRGDIRGETPMHRAALLGRVEVVGCLLVFKADKDKGNNDSITSLHHAARSNNVAIVRLLLEAGADKNARDMHGSTPMHHAALNGHVKVICCLLEAGARADQGNSDGVTPLQCAAEAGHAEVVVCLQADRDIASDTPLDAHREVAHLEAGVSDEQSPKRRKTRDGRTPTMAQ